MKENYILRIIESEVKYKKGSWRLGVINGFPYLLKSK